MSCDSPAITRFVQIRHSKDDKDETDTLAMHDRQKNKPCSINGLILATANVHGPPNHPFGSKAV